MQITGVRLQTVRIAHLLILQYLVKQADKQQSHSTVDLPERSAIHGMDCMPFDIEFG